MTLREKVAIAICRETSGGEGPQGIHECECLEDGKTECADMLRAADAALAAITSYAETQRQQIACSPVVKTGRSLYIQTRTDDYSGDEIT